MKIYVSRGARGANRFWPVGWTPPPEGLTLDWTIAEKTMKRLAEIEGLRGLALWVVLGHTILCAGYGDSVSGIMKLVSQGGYAVDIFIIISGFVIFYLIDQKKESYSRFLVRRVFRLWPVFILLFLIAIPLSIVEFSNEERLQALYPHAFLGDSISVYKSSWQHLGANIMLHTFLVHGVVPDVLIPGGALAFLGPAWSISLEWQFYLIAPFVFAFVAAGTPFRCAVASAGVVAISIAGKFLPPVRSGAFLPMHIEYFYLGCLSVLSISPGLQNSASCLASALCW